MNQFLKAALYYRNKFNFSVIPVRPDKKPYIAWTTYQDRIATVEEIKGWWREWPDANIAIITGKISGIVVVDIDTEKGEEELHNFIPDSVFTPTVATPRGGTHLYFKHPGLALGNAVGAIKGTDFRGEHGYVVAPPSVNGRGGWQWHIKITEVALANLPQKYISYVFNSSYNTSQASNIYNNKLYNIASSVPKTLDFNEGFRDDSIFHVANCLIRGAMEPGNVKQVLEILAQSCDPPFPAKELSAKIKSAIQRTDNHNRNLTQEVREWVMTTSGHIMTTDCHKELQLTTRREKKTCTMAFLRLLEEGVVERVGIKNGCYKLVDTECEDIDFLHAPTEIFDIKYPFQVEDLVETMPGNLVVIAGEVDTGKTALMLNIAKLNMDRHKCWYFSSEMGDTEMRKRLSLFDYMTLDDWKPLKAKARNGDFHDVIKPNDINIIDFLEIHENFFEIGKPLKKIHDKLKNGIAIVGVQKNPGVDTGLGGYRSMEVARLYLSLFKDYPGTRLKITKGKNWATKRNPNQLCIKYKTVDGCNLVQQGDWFREQQK